jgi:hypothetical protein
LSEYQAVTAIRARGGAALDQLDAVTRTEDREEPPGDAK